MLWSGKNLVLGSGSPRRKLLMEMLNISFSVLAARGEENYDQALQREAIPVFLSIAKAQELVKNISSDDLLITSDTIVWHNDKCLGKPVDEMDAFRMLQDLNGNTHEVFTAVTFTTLENQHTFNEKSTVTFDNVNPALLQEYISKCKPMDKAGSYGAQETLSPGYIPLSAEEIDFLNRKDFKDSTKHLYDEHSHFPIIKKIEGSYFNVMGLPIVKVAEYLFAGDEH